MKPIPSVVIGTDCLLSLNENGGIIFGLRYEVGVNSLKTKEGSYDIFTSRPLLLTLGYQIKLL